MDFTKLNYSLEIDTYIAFFERHARLDSEFPQNYLLVAVNVIQASILQKSQFDHDEVISQFHF